MPMRAMSNKLTAVISVHRLTKPGSRLKIAVGDRMVARTRGSGTNFSRLRLEHLVAGGA